MPSGSRIVSSPSRVRAGAPQASPRAARNSSIRRPLTSPGASRSSTSLATYRPCAVTASQVAEFHPPASGVTDSTRYGQALSAASTFPAGITAT